MKSIVHKLFHSFIGRLIIIIILSLSTAGILIYFSCQQPVLETLKEFSFRLVFIGILMMLSCWILDGIRLKNLARATNLKIKFLECIRIQLITEFTTSLTPSGMGGGPVKILLIQRQGASLGSSTTIFSVDKFVDFVFLLFIFPFFLYMISLSHISLSSEISLKSSIIFVTCIIILIAALVMVFYRYVKNDNRTPDFMNPLLNYRIVKWFIPARFRVYILEQTSTFFKQIKEELLKLLYYKKTVLLMNFILSAVKWNLRYGLLSFMLFYGFGQSTNYYVFFLLQGLIFFSSFFIMTPGGSGGVEMAYSILFAPFLPVHLIGVSLLIWRFYTYYLNIIIGGLVVFFSMGKEGIKTLLDM
ncbi:MAG: hypothetical protein A2161_03110 [Candidatus Schekmanbacteria bacterium RBG_13_48_7]|uniref:TIGR00374 family protein n=1 Tax=Candidatus Schekmanbacteria bacterium RBG_13_48_7 TaxID=1817878 RepID=A0A1F7RXW2_9BACT|nr:MAG: hypothetical protein A2161_03110 [Candidatus Schekmanbacteria bacterium RBG_13_48_7]